MDIEIGSYEAKTTLPAMLRGVQEGNRYTITLRGVPVAELGPAKSDKHADADSAVDQMMRFMHSQVSVGAGAGLNLKDLINEGRA
jgi:antitoxin (DNA-binding transcriptional repressor) of toxin-antitoxin stability system